MYWYDDQGKGRASNALRRAVLAGRIAPASRCEACGDTSLENNYVHHHWSYKKEHYLDTIEMCRSCHMRVHRGTLAEPITGRIYPRLTLNREVISAGRGAFRPGPVRTVFEAA